VEENFDDALTEEDWKRVEVMKQFLSPISTTITLLEGSKYPTLNIALKTMFFVRDQWSKAPNGDDKKRILKIFEKYFGDENTWYEDSMWNLCILATALDPSNFEFHYVRNLESKRYLSEKAKTLLREHILENSNIEDSETDDNPFNDWENDNVQSHISNSSEIESYFNNKNMCAKKNFNVLSFWKEDTIS